MWKLADYRVLHNPLPWYLILLEPLSWNSVVCQLNVKPLSHTTTFENSPWGLRAAPSAKNRSLNPCKLIIYAAAAKTLHKYFWLKRFNSELPVVSPLAVHFGKFLLTHCEKISTWPFWFPHQHQWETNPTRCEPSILSQKPIKRCWLSIKTFKRRNITAVLQVVKICYTPTTLTDAFELEKEVRTIKSKWKYSSNCRFYLHINIKKNLQTNI